jgi:hypothetical protein
LRGPRSLGVGGLEEVTHGVALDELALLARRTAASSCMAPDGRLVQTLTPQAKT